MDASTDQFRFPAWMLGAALDAGIRSMEAAPRELADELDLAVECSAGSWACDPQRITDENRTFVRDAPLGAFVDPDECEAVLAVYGRSDRETRAKAARILGEIMRASARGEISEHVTGDL